ncbi:hypothetical protein AKJ62_00210 [candidate division MSBL1 archaeon SCGC-AAA259D14]|uniref:Branched-chain amino acid ABC transporter permease n=1 Tax=candidate division MSBL1 archaeon SCGC-AAA259D14 TaxID=1698261 RepID=A0A133U8W1_9EURY|nr:hypothetical protein AKJ62_00210 [candidate division MSBL1 archaeon SCGC-AAA259D14]
MAVAPYIASVVLIAGIYIIFSFGLNLKFGFAGLIDFGHVAFMLIGAYTVAILFNYGVPFLIAALLGIIVSGLSALIISLPTVKLRVDYLAIFTIGFSQIVVAVARNEEWLTGGTMGLHIDFGLKKTPILGSIFHLTLIVIVTVIILYFILGYILNSPWGRVLKSVREDEEVPKSVGKNVLSYKNQTLIIGSAIAGLAGIFLLLYNYSYITPSMFLPMTTFYAWIIVIIGGSGNNRGTILGGLIFWTILEGTRFLRNYVPIAEERFGAIRMALIGLIIILIMRFKPEGILGKKEEMVLEKEVETIG